MNKEDFERCLVNPFDLLKADNVIEEYPLFKTYKTFSEPIKEEVILNRVLAYIVCVYDKNSPFQTHDNIIRIKSDAAELCNFPRASNSETKYYKDYMDIISCNNQTVNAMIISYCRIQGSFEWTELVTYRDKFFNMTLQLQNTGDASEEKTIIANIKSIKSIYKEVYDDFLSNDRNKNLEATAIDAIEMEILGLRPEDIAQSLQAGKDPVNIKPYGRNYKFERHEVK